MTLAEGLPVQEQDLRALERGARRLAAVPDDQLRSAVTETEPRREVRAAAATLTLAVRRTALLRGCAEAIARLDDAADAAGVGREHARGAALLGVLAATTPRL